MVSHTGFSEQERLGPSAGTQGSRAKPRFAVLVNSLDGRYQSDVLRGIRSVLQGRADLLVVIAANVGPAPIKRLRLRRRLPDGAVVDGLILLAGTLGMSEEDIRLIADHYASPVRRVPIVSVGLTTGIVPSINFVDEPGVIQAVRHLVEHHQYTAVGFLCGPTGSKQANCRLAAYQEALGPGLYKEEHVVRDGDFTFGWGQHATLNLLNQRPNIQAILAANDEMARGALSAIETRFPNGGGPAVIGFDDTEYASLASPSLTTVRQPMEEQGRMAALKLFGLYEDPNAPGTDENLTTELQIRESCGCGRPERFSGRADVRQVKAWVAQIVPDRQAVLRLVASFLSLRRQPVDPRRFNEITGIASRLFDHRLSDATTSDIAVWQHALLALREWSLQLYPAAHIQRAALDRFWVDLLNKAVRRGAGLALGGEDCRQALTELRNALDAPTGDPGRLAVLDELLPRLGLHSHWVCVHEGSDGGDATTISSQPAAAATQGRFPQALQVPGGRLPEACISYGFEGPAGGGHIVLPLLEPSTWWLYAEVASCITHALGGRLLSGVVVDEAETATWSEGHPYRRPAHEPPVEPKDVTSLINEYKHQAAELLERLRTQIPFTMASVQLINRDARTLFLAYGFPEKSANRSLLRPISLDPLVCPIVTAGTPTFVEDIRRIPEWNANLATYNDIQSWVGAPIMHEGEAIGLLTLDFKQRVEGFQRFRTPIINLTAELSPILANVVPLLGEQNQRSVLTVVSQIIDVIGETIEPSALLAAIVKQVAEHLNCASCTIFLPKRVGNRLLLAVEETSGNAAVRSRTFAIGEGIAGWVFREGKTLLLANARIDERFAPARQDRPELRSMLVVPIKVSGQTIGVICADQDTYAWFHQADMRLIEALAQQAGIAIQRAKAIKFLQDISASILSLESTAEILRRLVGHAISLMNASAGVIYHLSEDATTVKGWFSYPPDYQHPSPRLDRENGMTRQIIRTHRPIPIPDLATDQRVHPQLRDRFKSMIGVPLIMGDKVVGVLYVNDEAPHVFTQTEESLLLALAGQAAIALQKAELLENARRNEAAKADDVRKQTQQIFQNIEALFAGMEDALFAKRLGGFLVWKQMYHLLHSLDKHVIDPASYVEPSFHEKNHDVVYLDDGKPLSKQELYQYYLGVRDKVGGYLAGLDGAQLASIHSFRELRVSGLELILAQLRHVFYHVGYLHCCLKLEQGETPEYIGLATSKPA